MSGSIHCTDDDAADEDRPIGTSTTTASCNDNHNDKTIEKQQEQQEEQDDMMMAGGGSDDNDNDNENNGSPSRILPMKKRKNPLSASLIGAGPKKKQDHQEEEVGLSVQMERLEDYLDRSDRSDQSGHSNGTSSSSSDKKLKDMNGGRDMIKMEDEKMKMNQSSKMEEEEEKEMNKDNNKSESNDDIINNDNSNSNSNNRGNITPQINDVLIGKGPTIFHHVGNRRFRILVELGISSYFEEVENNNDAGTSTATTTSTTNTSTNGSNKCGNEERMQSNGSAPPTSRQLEIIRGVITSIEGNVPPGRFLIQENQPLVDSNDVSNGNSNEGNGTGAGGGGGGTTTWRVATPQEAVAKVQSTFVAAGRFLVKKAEESVALTSGGGGMSVEDEGARGLGTAGGMGGDRPITRVDSVLSTLSVQMGDTGGGVKIGGGISGISPPSSGGVPRMSNMPKMPRVNSALGMDVDSATGLPMEELTPSSSSTYNIMAGGPLGGGSYFTNHRANLTAARAAPRASTSTTPSPNPTELSASPHPPVSNMLRMHLDEGSDAYPPSSNPKRRASLTIFASPNNTSGKKVSIRCPPHLKDFCTQPLERYFVMDNPDPSGLTFLPSSYITPSNYDVLCGAGQAYFHHVGNRRFRIMIEMNVHLYEQCFLTLAGADNLDSDNGGDGRASSPLTTSADVLAAEEQIQKLIGETLQSISKCDPPGRFLGMDFATGRWRVLNPIFAKLKTEQTFFECMRVKLLHAKKMAEMESARLAKEQEEKRIAAAQSMMMMEENDLDGSNRSATHSNMSTNSCDVCPVSTSLQAIQNDPQIANLQMQARELLGRRQCVASSASAAAALASTANESAPLSLESKLQPALAMSEMMRKFAQEQSETSRALLRKIQAMPRDDGDGVTAGVGRSAFAMRPPLQERRNSLPMQASMLNGSSHHSGENDVDEHLNNNPTQYARNGDRRESNMSCGSDTIRKAVTRTIGQQSGGGNNGTHVNELLDVVGGMMMMSRRSSM